MNISKFICSGEAALGPSTEDGPTWHVQRKYMLKSLSDLGMGNRDTLEDIIEQEAAQFASLAKAKAGQQMTSRVIRQVF